MGRPVTIVSTKGQVILPEAIRDQRRWAPGTRLIIEETSAGVLLRQEDELPVTRPEDVFELLKYDGPPATIEAMNEAIAEEVRRRHDRGRY